MPTKKTRKKGKAQTAQIRQPSGSGKPDNYDGRSNTAADTPAARKPGYIGTAKTIKT